LADEPAAAATGIELLETAIQDRFFEAVIRVVAPVGDG
jgi:hypothetical protein